MKTLPLAEFVRLANAVIQNERIIFDFKDFSTSEIETMLQDKRTVAFFEQGLGITTKAMIAVSPLVQVEFANFPEQLKDSVQKLQTTINALRVHHIKERTEKNLPI